MVFAPAVRVLGLMVGKWSDSNRIMPQQTSMLLADKTIQTKFQVFK